MRQLLVRFGRLLAAGALLPLRALGAVALTVLGRPGRAARLLTDPEDPMRDAELPAPAHSPVVTPERPSPAAVLTAAALTLPMGALTLLAALLATLDELRVLLLYPLTDGGSIGPGTWGGPSLAGAWAVHAALGLVLFPVCVAVLAGATTLAGLSARRLVRKEPVPAWALPTAAVVDLAAVAFLIAFVRQI